MLGVVLVFVAALPLGLALHLELPLTRRVVLRGVTAALGHALRGRFEADALAALGPSRIELDGVRIDAEDGERALSVAKLVVDGPGWLGLVGLASSPRSVTLPRLALEDVTLDLRPTAAGVPRLAEALAERPGPPGPATKPPPRSTSVWLRSVTVRRLEVLASGPSGAPLAFVFDTIDGAVRLEPHALSVEAQHVAGRVTTGTPEPVDLDGRGTLTLPLDEGESLHRRLDGWGQLGLVAGLTQVNIFASMRNGRASADVDVPSLHATTLARWVPTVPLAPPSPLALRLRVEGPLDALAFEGQLDHAARRERNFPSGAAMPGRVEIRGALDETLTAVELDLVASELDLAAFSNTLPESRLGGRATLLVDVAAQRILGRLELLASEIASPGRRPVPLPAASGTFAAGAEGVDVRVRVAEPGCPGEALVRLGVGRVLEFAGRASIPSVGGLERLAALVPGLQRMRGRGSLTAAGFLRDEGLELGARGEFDSLAIAGDALRAGRLELASRLSGKLDALVIDASARGQNLMMGGRRLATASVRATGPLAHPTLKAHLGEEGDGTLDATATLDAARRSLEQLSVELRSAGSRLSASAGSLEWRPSGALAASKLRLGGGAVGGAVEGDLVFEGGELRGRLTGELGEVEVLTRGRPRVRRR